MDGVEGQTWLEKVPLSGATLSVADNRRLGQLLKSYGLRNARLFILSPLRFVGLRGTAVNLSG